MPALSGHCSICNKIHIYVRTKEKREKNKIKKKKKRKNIIKIKISVQEITKFISNLCGDDDLTYVIVKRKQPTYILIIQIN